MQPPTRRPVPRVSRAWRAELHARLLAWYDGHRRDLPWRRDADPYRVWVSEVMLQQIRVAHAAPYFEAWVRRFPTLQALADAPGDALLKAWEGLGLYARVGRMRQTARLLLAEHDGRFPPDPVELERLPGVGRYTAGMIASIAFGVPAPAVDGNVRRVLARLYDLADPTPAELERHAAALHRPERPGDFNQALIELGALVCLPRRPRCAACPVEALCRARARGVETRRGQAPPKRPPPHYDVGTAVAVDATGRLLLVRRAPQGGIAGLWEFPGAVAGPGEDPADAASRALHERLGIQIHPRAALGSFRHTVSGRSSTYHAFHFVLDGPAAVREKRAPYAASAAPVEWTTPEEVRDGYALSRAQRRIAALLD